MRLMSQSDLICLYASAEWVAPMVAREYPCNRAQPGASLVVNPRHCVCLRALWNLKVTLATLLTPFWRCGDIFSIDGTPGLDDSQLLKETVVLVEPCYLVLSRSLLPAPVREDVLQNLGSASSYCRYLPLKERNFGRGL